MTVLVYMGVAERKQREKAGREAAILAAAKEVFLAKGLLGTTIDDVAVKAELAKGTIYRHYRSKEDIMLAINEQALRELSQVYTQAAASGGTGLQKLLRMMRAYYAFVQANPAYFGFIAFFESPFVSTNAQVLLQTTSSIKQLFQQVLQQGMEDGSVRTDLNVDAVANTIWASSYGLMQFVVTKAGASNGEQPVNADKVFDTFLATLENGLFEPTA